MQTHGTPNDGPAAGLIAFDKWLNERGSTRTTGWRYRQQGLIETVNIFGRLFVSREQIQRFEDRAQRGEFSKKANTPLTHKERGE